MYTFAKFCRLCFKNNNFLIDYAEINLCNISYYDKMKKMIPALVADHTENFPTWICVLCRTDLDQLYIFHEKCLKTHELLKQYSKQLGYVVPAPVKKEDPEPIKEERLDIFDENTLSLDTNSNQSNISIVKNEIPGTEKQENTFECFFKNISESKTTNPNINHEIIIQEEISTIGIDENGREESTRHEYITEENPTLKTEIYDKNSGNKEFIKRDITEEILQLDTEINDDNSRNEEFTRIHENISTLKTEINDEGSIKRNENVTLLVTEINDEYIREEESKRHENITEEISTLETGKNIEHSRNEESSRRDETTNPNNNHEIIIQKKTSTKKIYENVREESTIHENITEKISTLEKEINDANSKNEESTSRHENITLLVTEINDENIREESRRLENITEEISILETDKNINHFRNEESTRRNENITEEISTSESDEYSVTEEVSSKRPILRNKRRLASFSYNELSENEDFSATDSNDSDFQPEKLCKSNFEKKIDSIIGNLETSDKNTKPNNINSLVQTDNQNILKSLSINLNSSAANSNIIDHKIINNSVQNVSKSLFVDLNSSDKSLNVLKNLNTNISESNIIDFESDNSLSKKNEENVSFRNKLQIELNNKNIPLTTNEKNIISNLQNDEISESDSDDDYFMDYFCQICNKKYENLSAHMDSHKPKNSQEFQENCVICNLKCPSFRYLFQHYSRHHKSDVSKCFLCDKIYPNHSTLVTHMYSHYNRKVIECPKCDKLFFSYVTFFQHAKDIHNETIFKCGSCDKNFDTPKRANKHILNVHGSQGNYLCHICGKTFCILKYFISHFKAIHTNEKIICSICGKLYSDKESLRSHIRIVHEKRRFKCDICSKEFANQSYLTTHKNAQHNGNKRFECKVCNKKFVLKSALINHERTHTGDKPFKCKICDKKFSQKYSVTVHMRTHTGHKPFSCKICGTKYSQSYVWKQHMRKHHGDEDEEKSDEDEEESNSSEN